MNIRECSRNDWKCASAPTIQETNAGSLQRIADACETMALHNDQIVRQRNGYKRLFDAACEREDKQARQLAARKGQITKLRKRIAELEAGNE